MPLIPGTLAPPGPPTPASRACVAPGSIGGSAPFHGTSAEPTPEIWTPGNTDGLNGSNPASYNEDSSSTTILNYALYRSRGWRLQGKVTANVTFATNAGHVTGPMGQFIVVAAGYASAVWSINEGQSNTTLNIDSGWVDIAPSAALTSIIVQVQLSRWSGSNASNDNITWNSANVFFQWVNP